MDRPEISLFTGPGEMARLMRDLDWSKTELGDPDQWPRSLRVAVRLLLGSGYPMYIAWGPSFIQFYNDAYRPILGKLKHPGALGSGSPETFPELWEFIGPMFRRVLQTGQETTLLGQALFLNRNGYMEECYYDFSYSPIPSDDLGEVGGVFVTCSEVTNQVFEQRRLKTVRDLGSSDGHATTPEQVCRTAAEVLAHNQHDIPFAAIYLVDERSGAALLQGVSGAAPGDAVCPEMLSTSAEEPWPVAAGFAASALQHIPDLQSRFAEIPAGPWPELPKEAVLIPLSGGTVEPIGFIVMGINARKQFDDAMEQFLMRCAQVIAGRVASARAFEDARRRVDSLAELDRAKTVFFSNISHEFRTPLTLIAGPLEDLALSPALSEADRERVDLAQRNAIRLQRLVNNLLDFSRIEAGRVTAAFEPVDLPLLTAELASGFQSTFDKAGVKLMVKAQPLSEPVYVDRDMWEKIVLNLLSNAFKFTFSGSVTVELEENADAVELRVVDTGVGIPEAELPKIFQRFHRIDGTRGRSYEGTGIGLALVHELVKIHGGAIEVASKPGDGTQFTVTLRKGTHHLDPEKLKRMSTETPVSARVDGFVMEALRWIDGAEDAAQAPLPVSDGAVAETVPVAQERRYCVLIVDDNADMRHYLTRLLEPFFRVETALNGADALRKIHRGRPDLVLADAMMPVMDGYGLLEKIRSTPEIAALPIIMVSARAGAEMEIEGRQAGADDYVTKPFSARELVGRVRSVLKIAEVRSWSEEAIRASENHAREILERTTDAVFVLDREWRFTYLNPNAMKLIANGRDLAGKVIWTEFPDAVEREFWDQYHRVMLERVSVEFQEYYPDPLDKWFEVHAYPTDQGIAVFFRDITLKVKADAALRQSEKLAAVGRLASSIAHEINNPLEAITNLMYLMECDESMQPQTRDFLRAAQSELARVSHIATQTLSFHRNTAHPLRVNPAEVVGSVVSLFSTRIAGTSLRIERQSRSSGVISAFPGELRQVISNLLRNAIEASGQEGRIVIRERDCTHPRTGEKGVCITIADRGHGMSREVRSRLYEPFVSTKPSTGTGLGLWVSKQIVEKHRGSIRARSSTEGNRHGTVFAVFLPCAGPSGMVADA
ncbi:MAG: ATP-binding protein [Acidobacteriota bacterium]